MRSIFTTSLLLLAVSTGMGAVNEPSPAVMDVSVMKALPIYSNNLIDKAPEGEVVTGIRDCYSSYFMSGSFLREMQEGVSGEYVMGTDGNIYLRAVCYSAAQISSKTDTYLKLEKVDDKTYVAHTPQLIWVDESEDSPFTAYATRVVHIKHSATSFGYGLEQNEDNSYKTDIFFTLEDGRLYQKNTNTIEMNGEIFPEELIGFTSSTGEWIGFGDGLIDIYQPGNTPVVLPDGAVAEEKSLSYSQLHVRDVEIDNAVLMKYSEAGDEIYISNPSAKTEQWVKGTIDREKGTATFLSQYLGLDTESGYAVWFIPAEYDKHLVPFDDEDPSRGEWFRNYTAIDKLVLNYENGILTGQKGQALYFSHSPEKLLLTGVYADPCIKAYESKSTTPAPVKFTKYEPFDDLFEFGVIGFAIPSMDKDGNYINPDELYYNVFPDDSTEPFVFTSDEYIDMEAESMTDVPYAYSEPFDFKVSGVNHTVYFYHDWKRVGVQVIQKHDGKETRSEIVYSDGSDSIGSVEADSKYNNRTYKYIDNGEVIIVRDGVKYNILGFPIYK